MKPLAHAEIEVRMKAAEKEHQDNAALFPEPALPQGMSHHDLKEWKEQQGVAARRRLAELADRIQQLQGLRTTLGRMKANTDNTLLHSPLGRWTLPGQPQPQQQQPVPPAKLGALNVSGDGQWSILEVLDGDLDSPARNAEPADDEVPVGKHTRLPAYLPPPYQPGIAPPLSPSVSGLRMIIRDEMNAVVSEVVTHQSHNSNTSHQQRAEADTKWSSPDVNHASTRPPSRHAWTAMSTVEPDRPPKDESESSSSEPPPSSRIKTKVMPRTLDEAEPKTLNYMHTYRFQQRSCPLLFGGMSRKSPLRLQCLAMMHSNIWSSIFFFCTFSSIVYSAVLVELDIAFDPNRHIMFDLVEYIFTGIFVLEILIGIFALGFVKGRTSWLQISGLNMLDFLILLSIIAEYIAKAWGYTSITVLPFRLLRTIKILCYFKMFWIIRVIVTTLMSGMAQMVTVLFVLIFFLLVMSTLLLTFLRDSFSRRCVVLDQFNGPCVSDVTFRVSDSCDFMNWQHTERTYSSDTPDSAFPVMIEDFYPFERWCKLQSNISAGQYDNNPNYDLDFKGRYHTCGAGRQNYQPGTEMCVEVGNPSYGFSHFDNIGGAMLSLAQGTVTDAYYDIIWRSAFSEPQAKPFLLVAYLLVTVLTTWLLLGIFVAVVTGTFKSIREEQKRTDEAEQAIRDKVEMRELAEQPKVLELPEKHDMKQDIDFRHTNTVTSENHSSQVHEFDPDVEILDEVQSNASRTFNDTMVAQARSLLETPLFTGFMSLIIIGHSVAIACNQHDAPQVWRDYAHYAHIVSTIVFSMELMVRIVSFWEPGFFSVRLNSFELVMVSAGVIGLGFQYSLLKLVPAMRLYRLMRYLPTLQHLLILAVGSFNAIFNVLVFVIIAMIAVTITGRYIFGKSMTSQRLNFDSIPEALLTVFELFTGNLSGVIYPAMHAVQGGVTKIAAAIFILAWFMFSSFIINNLFVAVIIENFEVTETLDNINQPGHLAALRKSFGDAWQHLSQKSQAVLRGEIRLNVHHDGEALDPIEQSFVFRDHRNPRAQMISKGAMASKGKSKRTWLMKVVHSCNCRYEPPPEPEDYFDERVLLCIPPGNQARKFFFWLGEQKGFDAVVLSAIISSCVFLILSPPSGMSRDDILRIDPTFYAPLTDQTILYCGWLFTFIFTAEFLVRILEYGLLFTKRAYLKNGWNILDTIILAMSWADFIIEFLALDDFKGGQLGKVLRLGRALRPLRLMKRNESMRAVIDALIGTLRPVMYVILFLLLTMVVFGLVGMGLFGGKYASCSTQDVLFYTLDASVSYPFGQNECVGYFIRDDGVMIQRAWVNPAFHFDTFSESFMTLFVVQTYKFSIIMQTSMDVTGVGASPARNASVYNASFFVLYVVVGGIFVMNLFIGFIVDGFNLQKGTTTAEVYYNRFMGQLKRAKPKYTYFPLPQNFLSFLCRKLIDNSQFQKFSGACVATNVCFNLSDYKGASPYHVEIISTQNMIFDFVLFGEVFICLLGFGPGGFFDDKWKGFDAFVAFGSLAGMIVQSDAVTKFSKAFRLVRILRLMIMIKPIRVILETLVSSLPQLTNIVLLLFLVYSMVAIFMVQIFGMTKNGWRIGATGGFYTYSYALYTIYQIVSGDEWHDMMSDHSVQWPECTRSFDEENIPGWNAWRGGPLSASVTDCGVPKLISFGLWMFVQVLCQYMLLNLFVGMILDNFSFITDENSQVEDSKWSGGPSANQVHAISKFYSMFATHKGSGQGMMPISALHGFLVHLPQPLGFRKPNGKLQYGPWEHACERLIRAELNVIVRYQRNELLHQQIHGNWNPFNSISNKHQDIVHKVGFIDFVRTCLFWRKSDMVPDIIKRTRWKRVDETLFTAYALILVDLCSNAVAFKKARRTNGTLKGLVEFYQWANDDAPRKSRRTMYAEEIKAEKNLALIENKTSFALYWKCTDNVNLVLQQVAVLPEDMISHHAAVRANRLKVPKPINGLEVFRNFSETHLVVLKFLDPKHRKSGYLIADFRDVNFSGWIIRSYGGLYTFLLPAVRRTKPAQLPEPWTRIEVSRIKGTSLLARSRMKGLGCLLDIQSFVHTEGTTREDILATATSKVRLNVGVLRVDFLASEAAASHKESEKGANEMFEVSDVVLEIVGYTPIALAGGADAMASALNTRRSATGDGSDAKSSPNAKPSQEMPQSPLKTVNTKILQDFDAVEEHWGQHQETKSEIEEREAEELRRVEEEYAAQQAVEQERVAKEEEQQRKRLADEEMEKQAERRRAEKEAARKKKDEETSRQKAVLEPAADPLGLG